MSSEEAPAREQLKALARGWFDHVMTARDVDAIDRLYAVDYTYSGPGSSIIRGREQSKARARYLIGAMRDRVTTVEDQLVDGYRVLTRWVSRGTPTTPLMGRDPDGRPVAVHGIIISRIADGVIAEDWEIVRLVDVMTLRWPGGGSGEWRRSPLQHRSPHRLRANA